MFSLASLPMYNLPMKLEFSIPKVAIASDDNLLYVIHHSKFTAIDKKTLDKSYEATAIPTPSSQIAPCIDENAIYYVDTKLNIVSVDKFSGEVMTSMPSKSIIASDLFQDNDSVYCISVMPTRLNHGINFTTYFVQQISKETGELKRSSYHKGLPTTSIVVLEKRILF